MQKLSTVGLYEFSHYSLSFPQVPVFCTFPHMFPDHIWFTGLLCVSKLVTLYAQLTQTDYDTSLSKVTCQVQVSSNVSGYWPLEKIIILANHALPLETLSISRCLNHCARCAWAMAVHHAVGISHQRNSGYRPSRINIMAQGLSTPDPSLSPTHLSIRRGRTTTTHYTHHQVSLMVSH